MNKDNMIDITGANLVDVAKAAYDLSSPQGMGILHYEEGSLTDDEAKSMVTEGDRCPLSLDYVKGRACKLTVFADGDRLYIPNNWYDHSPDQLKQLVERISS